MRKIVILQRMGLPSQDKDYLVAFRLEVPVARQSFYADANAQSAVRNAPAEELSALRAGEFVEQVVRLSAPANADEATALAMLEGSHARRQAELVDQNPWENYGTSWDGTAWTMVRVA